MYRRKGVERREDGANGIVEKSVVFNGVSCLLGRAHPWSSLLVSEDEDASFMSQWSSIAAERDAVQSRMSSNLLAACPKAPSRGLLAPAEATLVKALCLCSRHKSSCFALLHCHDAQHRAESDTCCPSEAYMILTCGRR